MYKETVVSYSKVLNLIIMKQLR